MSQLTFQFLDNNLLSKLPRVTSSKIKNTKRFDRDGIFSEQIFGPVNDYKCWCNIPHQVRGEKCPECDIVIGPSSLRKKIFAVIELPIEIISPQAYLLFKSSKKFSVTYSKIMSGYAYLSNDPESIDIMPTNLKELESVDGLTGTKALEELVLRLAAKDEFKDNSTIQLLYQLIESGNFKTRYVLVIPPHYRPYKESYMAEVNKYYLTLLVMNNKFNKLGILEQLMELEYQKVVDKLTTFILDKFSGKTGLFRARIAGKRLDLSGRAVIVPDNIPYTHVKIPRLILLQLYKLEITREMIKKYNYTYREAFELIDYYYNTRKIPDSIREIIDNVSRDRLVILNRQPTLHRGSMIAFKVIPTDDMAIGLNHLVVDPFNADFDGDAMAVYHLINESEADRKLHINAAFSAADGELQYYPKQDIIYSIYQITATEEGRKWLSEQIDVEVKERLDKKKLIQLLKDKFKEDPSILEKIKEIGLEYAKENPVTLSILDFLYTKHQIGDVSLSGNIQEDMKILKEKEAQLKKIFPKKDIVDSGARASYTQIMQMAVARGYVSDFRGNIVPYPIKSSYIDGLSQEEFFWSNYGTRKAVLDTALNVAESGYLTRRLVYVANSAVIDPYTDDCGTEKTIRVEIDDIDLAKRLKYRWYYEKDPELFPTQEPKQVDDLEEIVGKIIYLRSPIHCISKKYCRKCYGGLYDIHKSRFVGIIAAQTLGERSTQLTLRTFHTGGVAEVKSEKSTKQEDIVSALKVVEFIIDKRRQIGNINDIYNMVFDLYRIFKDYSTMHLIHIEILVSEKIYRRYEDGSVDKWRLTDQNDFYNVYAESSKIIPSLQSPLLGAMFEKASENLVKVVMDNINNMSVLDKIILGIPID